MTFKSINPTTGQIIAEFVGQDQQNLSDRLSRIHDAQQNWKTFSFFERGQILHRLADVIKQDVEKLATLAALEMGKPVNESRAELLKCAGLCDFYADHGGEYLADLHQQVDFADRSFVHYEPLGIVFGIMPWNFPYWQVMRFTVPALMAGNAVVLKHAPTVQKCAHAIEELMRIAGLPDGIFSNLVIDVDLVEDVIAHPAVQAVTVTGSISTGRRVASLAGSYLKKVMPELGGSDPFIVLDDADIEVTLDRAVQAKFANAGQSCIAAKRFIVLPEIAESFVQGLVSRVSQLRVGDPLDKDTQIGPMAREDLRDRLHAQVLSTLSAGAVPLIGCQPIAGPGYFYTPSVIDHIPIGTPARQEEIFGPVAVIIRAKDEDDAISIANETQYGLGATIWSRDVARAEYLLSKVQAGMTYVNSIVRSDPLLPFGGIKATGFGRSLSFYSIREFCQARTVWINDVAK